MNYYISKIIFYKMTTHLLGKLLIGHEIKIFKTQEKKQAFPEQTKSGQYCLSL